MKKAILFAIILLFSCKNPFVTGEPEQPKNSDGSGQYEIPTNPSVVIDNLLSSYNHKDIGNYTSCFADSFRFYAAREDSANSPQTFSNWGLELETSTASYIFSQDSVTLQLLGTSDYSDFEDFQDGVATYYRLYTLIVSSSENATLERPAEGIAQFKMSKNSQGNWHIYEWHDIADTSDNRWSQVKEEFVGG